MPSPFVRPAGITSPRANREIIPLVEGNHFTQCLTLRVIRGQMEYKICICQSLRFLCPTVQGGTSSQCWNAVGVYFLVDLFSGQKSSTILDCKGVSPVSYSLGTLLSACPVVGGVFVAAKGCDNLAPPRQPQTHGATHETCKPPLPSAGASLELQGLLLLRPDGWDVGLLTSATWRWASFSLTEAASLAGRNSGTVGNTTLSTDQSARDSN
jgi:hypothetical protein